MCGCDSDAWSVCCAALLLENANAAVQVCPMISAFVVTSLTRRARKVRSSYITNPAATNTTESTLVDMITTLSFLLMGLLRNEAMRLFPALCRSDQTRKPEKP